MPDTIDPMAEVIEQMPAPSEFAETIQPPTTEESTVETVEPTQSQDFSFEEQPSAPASTQGTVYEEVFDPTIHCVDENGQPKRTKAGKYRRKRGKASAYSHAQTADPMAIDPNRMANAKAAAQVSVAATFVAGQIIFGPEGQPLEGEPQQMLQAYEQFYYLSEKPINVPPWMLIAMVTSSYIAKRMAMEVPRSRVMTAFGWIKDKSYAVYKWVLGG